MNIDRNKIIFVNTMIETDINIWKLIINLFEINKTKEVTKWKTILEFENFTIFAWEIKKYLINKVLFHIIIIIMNIKNILYIFAYIFLYF